MTVRPFELSAAELQAHLDQMVEATIDDLTSQVLLLPKGPDFIEYADFQAAYQVLRQQTAGYSEVTVEAVAAALAENSRVFLVLRAILGMTAAEWAAVARADRHSDVSQNAARSMDRNCRSDARYCGRLGTSRGASSTATRRRLHDMTVVAVAMLASGAPPQPDGTLHRLAQFDTAHGLESLQHAAWEGVPHATLLYERYLGRPFAGHRDAVSELIGGALEDAVEDQLRRAGIAYRKTKRAKRIPGFGQAPDFCIPDELAPAVDIEAKLSSDDGTARDKVARIKVLASQRDQHVVDGRPPYQVIACIDGRGFGQRREDMRQLLTVLDGKVFTTATLPRLVPCSRLADFAARAT